MLGPAPPCSRLWPGVVWACAFRHIGNLRFGYLDRWGSVKRMAVTMTTPDKCSICGRWPATLRPAMRRAVLSIPRHGACEDCHDAFAANLLVAKPAFTPRPTPPRPHHTWQGVEILLFGATTQARSKQAIHGKLSPCSR